MGRRDVRDMLGLAGLIVGILSVVACMWAVAWLLDGLSRGVVGLVEPATAAVCALAGGIGFHLWHRAVDGGDDE